MVTPATQWKSTDPTTKLTLYNSSVDLRFNCHSSALPHPRPPELGRSELLRPALDVHENGFRNPNTVCRRAAGDGALRTKYTRKWDSAHQFEEFNDHSLMVSISRIE